MSMKDLSSILGYLRFFEKQVATLAPPSARPPSAKPPSAKKPPAAPGRGPAQAGEVRTRASGAQFRKTPEGKWAPVGSDHPAAHEHARIAQDVDAHMKRREPGAESFHERRAQRFVAQAGKHEPGSPEHTKMLAHAKHHLMRIGLTGVHRKGLDEMNYDEALQVMRDRLAKASLVFRKPMMFQKRPKPAGDSGGGGAKPGEIHQRAAGRYVKLADGSWQELHENESGGRYPQEMPHHEREQLVRDHEARLPGGHAKREELRSLHEELLAGGHKADQHDILRAENEQAKRRADHQKFGSAAADDKHYTRMRNMAQSIQDPAKAARRGNAMRGMGLDAAAKHFYQRHRQLIAGKLLMQGAGHGQ